jgi:aminoglycoside phosphotransferase family enzyme
MGLFNLPSICCILFNGGLLFSFDTTRFFVPHPGTYSIEKRIITYASRIFYIEDKGHKFCVKMYRPLNDDLYQTNDPFLRAMYLLEGFNFNSQHAPEVYIGLGQIQLVLQNGENEDTASALTLYEILTSPQKDDLEKDKEYGLVMKRLNDDWQLSALLPDMLANNKGMEVLAQQIALMHQRLSQEPQDLANALQKGSTKQLQEKLDLNKKLFSKALEILSLAEDENHYTAIPDILTLAYKDFQRDFAQREKNHHIKHCHGDLKATNLWLFPEREGMADFLRHKTHLLALDCIDFMPEFCCIDTLSDVAMLAIDIEFYNNDSIKSIENSFSERTLATHFLETYLQLAQDQQSNVWRLLNYYMLEKAMIGTYGSIIKYGELEIGKRYLYLANKYATYLQSQL